MVATRGSTVFMVACFQALLHEDNFGKRGEGKREAGREKGGGTAGKESLHGRLRDVNACCSAPNGHFSLAERLHVSVVSNMK